MSPSVRTELLKLWTTRTPKLLVGVAFVLTAARVVLVLVNAGKVGAASLGTMASTRDILLAPGSAALLFLVMGVLTMTTEARYGTGTWAFLAWPDRARVVVAKAAAVSSVAVAYAVVAILCVAFVAATAPPDWSGMSLMNGPVVGVIVGSLIALPLYAILGVAVGAIVSNQVAAVLLPLSWFVAIENLLPSYGLGRVVVWLPGGASAALAGADLPGLLPMWGGGLLLITYVAAFLAIGVVLLRRRDVT